MVHVSVHKKIFSVKEEAIKGKQIKSFLKKQNEIASIGIELCKKPYYFCTFNVLIFSFFLRWRNLICC